MLLEEGITPAGPDMIAGIDAQPRDVLLEVAKFNARFAKLVQSLQVGVMWRPVLVISLMCASVRYL